MRLDTGCAAKDCGRNDDMPEQGEDSMACRSYASAGPGESVTHSYTNPVVMNSVSSCQTYAATVALLTQFLPVGAPG